MESDERAEFRRAARQAAATVDKLLDEYARLGEAITSRWWVREEADEYSALQQRVRSWAAALNCRASHVDPAERDKAFWGERLRTDPDLRDDWEFWAWYLELGGPFFEELRPILVKGLRGDPRPGHRIKSIETHLRQFLIAFFVSDKVDDGCGPDKAVEQVAETFGVDKRTAQNAVKKFTAEAEEFLPNTHESLKEFIRLTSEKVDAWALTNLVMKNDTLKLPRSKKARRRQSSREKK
jgi:hypothetical protein